MSSSLPQRGGGGILLVIVLPIFSKRACKWRTHPASAYRSRRRSGRSKACSASPAAITQALKTSMRPREFARSSPGFPFGSRRSVDFEIAVASERFSAIANLR